MSRKIRHVAAPIATRAARGLPAVGLLLGVMITGVPIAHSVAGALPPRAPHRVASNSCRPAWVGAWQATPVQFNAGTEMRWKFNQRLEVMPTPAEGSVTSVVGRTLRLVVPPAASGSQLRLRLSNRFGEKPLALGSVVVARQAAGPAVVPGTRQAVTFAGAPTVTIAQGDDIVSDAVPYAVNAHEPLSVSIYVVDAPEHTTRHLDTRRTSYISQPGDYTDDGPPAGFVNPILSSYYLTGLDVLAPRPLGAVVAIGDSITDGMGSTADADRRFPDVLQSRLEQAGGNRRMAVLNAGVGGNRVLNDEQYGFGESALRRLALDAAASRGAVDVILHEGTNDAALPYPMVSAPSLIDGMKRFARTAHGLGLRVFATTITPSLYPMHSTPHAVEVRDETNAWIRTHATEYFDGMFDFAAAVADPANAHALAAPYDLGDQLHLSDAGLARLAEAVDVNQLSGSPCQAEKFSA